MLCAEYTLKKKKKKKKKKQPNCEKGCSPQKEQGEIVVKSKRGSQEVTVIMLMPIIFNRYNFDFDYLSNCHEGNRGMI